MANEPSLTATEEVLLAAAKLTNNTKKEFTEWELTVETWRLNKNRWGLRGYESKYPNHKRVMNEIMATGTQKIIGKGWLEKIRPNYYKLTSLGLAKADSLSHINVGSKIRSLHEYESISPYVNSKVFESYLGDNSEPKTWLGAASFLGLKGFDPDDLERKLKKVKESIKSTLKWLDENKETILKRSDSSKPIPLNKIKRLEKFIVDLEERFKAQFDAIRKKKK